jgi:hypothetical protein
MNIYEKIQAVANEVRNIEKDLTVGSGSYAYKAVGDQAVTLAVKDAEKKYKLVSIPVSVDIINSEVIKTLDGNREKLTYHDLIKMTVEFVDLEKPESKVTVTSIGRGVDSGDKGPGKAMTYARKYALLNAYKIATGEDPDAEKSKESHTAATIDERRAKVVNYYNDIPDKKEALESHFGTPIEKLTDAQIKTVYGSLIQKKLI